MAAGEGDHAVAAPRHEKRLQLHPGHDLLGGGTKALPILDTDTEGLFQFGLVGRGSGHAGKFQHAEARIEDHWNSSGCAFPTNLIQDGGRSRTVAIVGNQ